MGTLNPHADLKPRAARDNRLGVKTTAPKPSKARQFLSGDHLLFQHLCNSAFRMQDLSISQHRQLGQLCMTLAFYL